MIANLLPHRIMFKHPSTEERFAEEHGLDVSELEKKAREYDEKKDLEPEGTAAGSRAACKSSKHEPYHRAQRMYTNLVVLLR